jgi:hypothetical protein
MTNERTLTDWFPAPMKPVRDGVYQTQYRDGLTAYRKFSGGKWHQGFHSPTAADATAVPISAWLHGEYVRAWRGLTESAA